MSIAVMTAVTIASTVGMVLGAISLGSIVDRIGRKRAILLAVTQSTDSTFLKRYNTLEEQVRPILFMASDDASYITGTVLEVSCGDRG